MSKLIDIMTSPWAITPSMLTEIRGIYETHLRGEKINIAGIETRLGRKLNNETKDYEVINNVAIIPVIGAIAKRMNLFSQISGGVSTDILNDQINHAMQDTAVNSIVLEIDSPGGTVDGTFDIADAIYNMRGDKPIVAFADGLMASAAYAIGSAADSIYISGETTTIGSIGVVATHVDVSKAEEKFGQKTTEITAGKYKRISSQHEPLSEEGRADIQASVDYLYSIFVERVARYRDVSTETVIEDMADGRLFIGQQAIDAGLVDGVSTFDALIDTLSMGRLPEKQSKKMETGAGDAQTVETLAAENIYDVVEKINPKLFEESKMDITQANIAEHHPDIAEAFRAEGVGQGREEGATAERERIQDVNAQSIPGHEELINTLAFDGQTTGPEAAVQVLNAERKVGKDTHNAHIEDAPKPVEDAADADTSSLATAPLEERAQADWDKSEELQAEFGGNFKTYLAYRTAQDKGCVKIAGKKS